jgi:hypothetical protein
MFHDLDATLAKLIEREVEYPNLSVSFAVPNDQFPPSNLKLPAVHFFLYHLEENMELRRGEWIIEHQDNGSASRRRPPVRVNCAYLVTVWPSESADEHELLGAVMKGLLRHRRLPADLLQGELAGQEPPLRASIIRESHLQSLGEFWQAMGARPKAALDYSVTISVDIAEPEDLGPVVSESVIKLQARTN